MTRSVFLQVCEGNSFSVELHYRCLKLQDTKSYSLCLYVNYSGFTLKIPSATGDTYLNTKSHMNGVWDSSFHLIMGHSITDNVFLDILISHRSCSYTAAQFQGHFFLMEIALLMPMAIPWCMLKDWLWMCHQEDSISSYIQLLQWKKNTTTNPAY